ncbi:MAG: glycosyltransferase family 2 protein [Candidatus Scalindua sp.]|nr:glycosyltransferase family 2 protein [Candidatus Scalindua sp.]
MKISICIPTYNRAKFLKNCINSIVSSISLSDFEVQVCISDNCSTDQTEDVVRDAQSILNIKYHKNSSNLGIPRNFINVVSMAEGDFIWLIGDDDLLMPNAIEALINLISGHPGVDFFYVNAYHLTTEYLNDYPKPFDTKNLPVNMEKFSKWEVSGEMPFLDLINPKISFDFLGGMFLSVFKREHWIKNVSALDEDAIQDARTFSHFDNTFPHVKIFSRAFSESNAYFNNQPLCVCLTGAREWSPMYPFIHSIRLVEALDEYRNNGLSYLRYVYCKNYALNNFMSDYLNILLRKDISGYSYVDSLKIFKEYFLYPNVYLSFFYFIGRRVRRVFSRVIDF